MHSLPATFALWRLQGETVADLLFDRRKKRQSKHLKSILKTLDQVWMNELGEPYVNELLRLIDLHQKDAGLLDSVDIGSDAAGISVAANDDDFGLVVSPQKKGEAL